MDLGTVIVEVVKAAAGWVFGGFVLYVYRVPIGSLIPFVRELRWKNKEAEFALLTHEKEQRFEQAASQLLPAAVSEVRTASPVTVALSEPERNPDVPTPDELTIEILSTYLVQSVVRAGLISPAELVEKGRLPTLSNADYVELAIRRLEPEAGAFMLAVIKRMVDKANVAWERMPEHLQVQVTTAGIEPPEQK